MDTACGSSPAQAAETLTRRTLPHQCSQSFDELVIADDHRGAHETDEYWPIPGWPDGQLRQHAAAGPGFCAAGTETFLLVTEFIKLRPLILRVYQHVSRHAEALAEIGCRKRLSGLQKRIHGPSGSLGMTHKLKQTIGYSRVRNHGLPVA